MVNFKYIWAPTIVTLHWAFDEDKLRVYVCGLDGNIVSIDPDLGRTGTVDFLLEHFNVKASSLRIVFPDGQLLDNIDKENFPDVSKPLTSIALFQRKKDPSSSPLVCPAGFAPSGE